MPTPRMHPKLRGSPKRLPQRQALALTAQRASKGLPGTAPIPTMPSTARWRAMGSQAQSLLRSLADEMENYRDDRSEDWQEGERGQAFEDERETVREALLATEAILS